MFQGKTAELCDLIGKYFLLSEGSQVAELETSTGRPQKLFGFIHICCLTSKHEATVYHDPVMQLPVPST